MHVRRERPQGYGHRLLEHRLRARMTQEEVAEQIVKLASPKVPEERNLGVNAQMVSKWEREIVVPGPVYRRLLARLFQITQAELGFHADARSTLGAAEVENAYNALETTREINQ